MSGVQSLEQRLVELHNLRKRIDAEARRVKAEIAGRPTPRRSKFDPVECGTEQGYQRHRYQGETCDECRAAHNEHNRIQYAARAFDEAS